MDPRVVKVKTPPRLIVAAVLIGLFLLGFIIFAVYYSGLGIKEARMTGTVIKKEFQPQKQEEVTVNRNGSIRTSESEGNFILTVAVPQSDGTKKEFNVWMPNRQSYEAVKVGDNFDVGPYLQKSE